MSHSTSFTGRSRLRKTRWTVHAADVAARNLIRIGGIGTIVAVSTVCLFLVWVVVPLFLPAELSAPAAVPTPWHGADLLEFAVDEYRLIGWALSRDGMLRIFRPDNGAVLSERLLFEGAELTAASITRQGNRGVFGFADGTVRLGRIGFETTFLEAADVPEEVRRLARQESRAFDEGMIQPTPQRQFRLQTVTVELAAAEPICQSAVRRLHLLTAPGDVPVFAAVADDGRVFLSRASERRNLLTGKPSWSIDSTLELPLPEARRRTPAAYALVMGRGETVCVAWRDGRALRFDAGDAEHVRLAEELDLVEDSRAELTALGLLLGEATLVAGDSVGRLSAWFAVHGEPVSGSAAAASDAGEARSAGDAETAPLSRLVRAHPLPTLSGSITALGMSTRSRMLAAGSSRGEVAVYHVTSERQLVRQQLPSGGPVERVLLAPKEDGLFAADAARLARWDFNPRHPEASVRSLFRPVWYEGRPRPEHSWQSSGGSDDLEPKLGLMPLIFGTVKATFYSMLFGAPLALLAAVYTSEFLHPRAKARIKPTIEMMASLPSVVLGFLAALVFAPIVQQIVPAVLAVLVTLPGTILLAAYAWQLAPYEMALRWQWLRLPLMCLTVPAALGLAALLGPVLETWLFAGDVMRWLDGQIGNGVGAWLILWLPLTALGVAVSSGRWVNPRLRQAGRTWSRAQFARAAVVKFVVQAAVTLVVALGISGLLNAAGLDPRGSFVDTYDQRNALVVGFVMGFAVIPLIYTIADDALSSVPEHLRSASLGAGATPWQTAVNVVIPTAMSGLFSAIMIGLGRCVGETMIVLMAAGNTPVMKWNVFSGFRTLSANIAVELPEAVRDSTHYRTLFLAALTLFVLTFAVNTAAEMVRLRFRRRVYEL